MFFLYLKNFVLDTVSIVFNPVAYFKKRSVEQGAIDIILKIVVYGTVSVLLNLLLLSKGLTTTGPQVAVITYQLVLQKILGAFILYITGFLVLYVLAIICRGETEFKILTCTAASLFVVSPIVALVGLLGMINFILASFVSMSIYLYWLWIVYRSMVSALYCNQKIARVICVTIGGIIGIILLWVIVIALLKLVSIV